MLALRGPVQKFSDLNQLFRLVAKFCNVRYIPKLVTDLDDDTMSTTSSPLYDVDFYAWIQQQANVLKAGDFARLDLDNLIDEIESMGKSEK